MAETAKKQIGEKVVVGVISAIILGALAYFSKGFLLPMLTTIGTWTWGLTKSFSAWFFVGSIAAPTWLFCILSVSTLVLLVLVLSKIFAGTKINAPSRTDYTEDNFFGMTWRWRYMASGQIANLWCYCPNDKTCLVYKDDFVSERSTGLMTPAIELRCETCGQKNGPHVGDPDSLKAKVERQIYRKLDADEWQAVVANKVITHTKA